MAGSPDKPVVLYHYPFSPYARKVIWYLALRGLPYTEVKVTPIMPRPDLQEIGVNYRRIPVAAIGKDVYADSRIILRKLEEHFPEGRLGGSTPEAQLLQKLLEIWHDDGRFFARATQTMPSTLPVISDAKFTKDRAQMTGREWTKENIDKNRPEALVHVRNAYDLLERTILSDGRNWVLNGDKPTLLDIETAWVVHWLTTLPGALPENLISKQQYPKVFSFIARFDKAVEAAKKSAPKPKKGKGKEVASQIQASSFVDSVEGVEETDPQNSIKVGEEVELYPTDSGFSHHDKGKLFGLGHDEVVIELSNGLRLHTPRTNFKLKHVGSASKL